MCGVCHAPRHVVVYQWTELAKACATDVQQKRAHPFSTGYTKLVLTYVLRDVPMMQSESDDASRKHVTAIIL